MTKLFGTDGVRGIANSELTAELAFHLGRGLVNHIGTTGKRPEVLIGMDTRRSGHMLEASVSAGILSAGGDVRLAGVIPTPAVAYLTKCYGLSAGCVISASHNPFFDNGLKFFDAKGHKIDAVFESAIENFARKGSEDDKSSRPVGGKIGVKRDAKDAVRDYSNYIKSLVGDVDLAGLNIVLDCANGAMYKAAPMLFDELLTSTTVLADEPNGENINLRCGSMHMEACREQVLKHKADVGFSFDGDGDRCLVVDELGNVVDGDQIMCILALYYKSLGKLRKNAIVSTVMSNIGMEKMCENNGLDLIRTPVGDKHVFAAMMKGGYTLGGEQSGHIINLDFNITGDGLSAALQIAMAMKDTGKKLSELASAMEKYPQVVKNVRVSNELKSGYLTSSEINNAIKSLEDKLEGFGRVLVRPSGTEPLIRIMIEGRSLEEITADADALAALIEDVLS